MSAGDAIAALQRARDATLPFYASPPDVLERSYAPGKWTMRQLLVHLADAESVLLDRLRRVAADDKPLLWAYDENLWAERLWYPRRSLETARGLYAAAREAIIELAALAPTAVHERTGIHSENGRRSFAQVLEMAHTHNEHHLSQLQAITAGQPWIPRTAVYALAAEPKA